MARPASSGRRQPQSNESTSVEREFASYILLIKLCGGFLFDWRRKWLAVVYRLLAIALRRPILPKVYKSVGVFMDAIPSHHRVPIDIAGGVINLTQELTLWTNVLFDIVWHNTIKIIFDKQFDRR